MADTQSFDITTGVDLQEVDNAVNQARKELTQRYDFRNVPFEIELERDNEQIKVQAPDAYKLDAVWDVLQTKLIKRSVAIKNLKASEIIPASNSSVRRDYKLQMGIDSDAAKAIVKFIKDQKLKKVQASIQKDQVRVQAPSRDELQAAIASLRQHDFGIELSFGNYR